MSRRTPHPGPQKSAPQTAQAETIAALEKARRAPPIEVTSVDVLEVACREAIVCEFEFKDKLWKVTGRLLTPAEQDRVNLILEQAVPDLIAPKAGEEGDVRYDLRNPSHLANKAKYKAQARALALYLAYPIFAQHQKVKLVTTPKLSIETLTDVMQDFFTTDIQEELWWRAVGRSRLRERIDFF